MKKKEFFKYAKKAWIKENIAFFFLEKVTGLQKKELFFLEEIDDKYLEILQKYFSRYKLWEPLEYILQKAEFFSLEFFVDSRVLIPRNDTEILVEKAIEEINKNKKNILIDVWTGSACIPISIAKNTKNIEKIFAIDISKEALEVAKINIKKHSLEDKIKLINSNLLENFELNIDFFKNWNIENLIITANLPYVKNWDFENMDEETVKFEPDVALYWWEKTGFELYEKLTFQILDLKNNFFNNKELGVVLFIEIWFDQKKVAVDFLQKNNLQFNIFKDNSWIDRCIKIYF